MNSEVENIVIEYKSLRKVTTGDSGLRDLAVTCVCLANSRGGTIYIGIEDGDKLPPPTQIVSDSTINATVSRLRTLCFNVGLSAGRIEAHDNGGQYFRIVVHESVQSIATTSDGKIYKRVGDQCQPVRNEDLQRLSDEKGSFQWEVHIRGVKVEEVPEINIRNFANEIRNSERVKQSVRELSDLEIVEHYNLVTDGKLTNLGTLWLGSMIQRSRLLYPITVQYIVYDSLENKIRKVEWHDNSLNPKELILDIEKQTIELTYFDEFPQGLFRKQIRHYDPRIIRELLLNAIAHKSYTISGDIFIKVYPTRMEISNPGGLPLGITKDNILHRTIRRNPHLIRILHDLGLMEGEGSGYDLMYEITSRDAKPFPVPESDYSSTTVTQSSNILDEESLLLIDFMSRHYELSQKEFIVLGIISRHKKILSTHLTKELQLSEEDRLRSYITNLSNQGIVIKRGVKKGTEYLINPQLITSSKINIKPTLKIIESPRLKALIEEILKLTPNMTMRQIHEKLEDVTEEDVRKSVYKLVKDGVLGHSNGKTHRKYWVAKKNTIEKENEDRNF